MQQEVSGVVMKHKALSSICKQQVSCSAKSRHSCFCCLADRSDRF